MNPLNMMIFIGFYTSKTNTLKENNKREHIFNNKSSIFNNTYLLTTKLTIKHTTINSDQISLSRDLIDKFILF